MYTIHEVKTISDKKAFLQLPVKLYRKEKNWIRPLDKDIEEVFDPSRNKSFRNGECTRWIIKDEKHRKVGRVAVFIDHKAAENNEQPTGGMGFFECINDKVAAFLMFDSCKQWLQERGMEAMDGPVNFGDRDKWWGLLVEGFYEPNYCMPYHLHYYKDLFESYGFKNYFNQFTFHRLVNREGVAPEVLDKAVRISKNHDYRFVHFDLKHKEQFIEDFRTIYNKGWAKFTGVKPISILHAKALFKSIAPILDPNLIWYAYYKDVPVAFLIMIPEINQIIKHFRGKLNVWNKIRFLYYSWSKECTKVLGIIFGIIPEHQGKGLEAALILAFADIAWKPGFRYKEMEMNWIGDFNPSMIKTVEKIGATIRKVHVTYRYLFDPAKEFKRAKVVNR